MTATSAWLMYFAVIKLLFSWNKQGTLCQGPFVLPIISKIFEQEIFQQLYT